MYDVNRLRSKNLLNTQTKKDVFRIAWPVLVELLLGSLFGMVDMMMLGRMSNKAAAAASMAAVGITNQPLFIGLSLIQALNVGATAMISRYVGSNQHDKIEPTLKHVLLLSLMLLTIPISLFGLIYTEQIMEFMGAKADAIYFGKSYFRIIMVGFIFQSINMSLSAALRGIGKTRIPMKINLRVNGLNVLGNALLIYGLFGFPKLGVTGAAISTAVSQVLATIILMSYVVSGKSLVKLNLRHRFKFDYNIMYNLIRIGIPASLEQMVLRFGIVLFVRIVAGLGTVVFATHQIALNILSLSFQPGQAFGIAAATLVGKNLGAKEPEKAEEYANETRRMGTYISTFMAVILFFFGSQIVGLYTQDEQIIKSASTVLKIIALVQPFQSSQLILAGGLRGAGDTVWPLIATIVGVLFFRVGLAYILVSIVGLGLIGAWLAIFVDQFIRWVFIYLRFKTGHWKNVRIR